MENPTFYWHSYFRDTTYDFSKSTCSGSWCPSLCLGHSTSNTLQDSSNVSWLVFDCNASCCSAWIDVSKMARVFCNHFVGFSNPSVWPRRDWLQLSGWEQGGNQLFGNHSHYSMHLAVAGILPCSVHVWLLAKDRAQTLEACIHSEHNGTWPSDRIWLNCSSCIETHDVLQAPNWSRKCLELP